MIIKKLSKAKLEPPIRNEEIIEMIMRRICSKVEIIFRSFSS